MDKILKRGSLDFGMNPLPLLYSPTIHSFSFCLWGELTSYTLQPTHAVIKQHFLHSNYLLYFFPYSQGPPGLFPWFLQTSWHRHEGSGPIFVAPEQTYTARSHVSSLVGAQLNAPIGHLLISHAYLPACHFNAFVYAVLGLLERAVRGGGAVRRNSSSVNQSKQIELKAVPSGAAELLWWYVSDSTRSRVSVSYACQGVLRFPCNSNFLGRGGLSVNVDHLPLHPWI